jgi:hypothetical protein
MDRMRDAMTLTLQNKPAKAPIAFPASKQPTHRILDRLLAELDAMVDRVIGV